MWLKRKSPGHSLKEPTLSFRGNWCLRWVIQRYWQSSRSTASFKKLANAALALAEMTCGQTRVRSRPSVLRIEPTNVCNLHCPRCSCGIGQDPRQKGYMTLADYNRVLEENREYVWFVRLDGNGEPTLHPQIFEMIALAKSHGYSVSMSTNFCIRQCADVHAFLQCGLNRLVVAIDGNTQESYARYRVGGELPLVKERLAALLAARGRRAYPLIEVQFLDWGYNHEEIPKVWAMADAVRG